MAGRPKSKTPTNRAPRPCKNVAASAAELLRRMAEGDTVSDIAKELGLTLSAIWDYRQSNQDFAAMYARARIAQTDAQMEGLVSEAKKYDDPQRARLVVDTLKWIASKRKPNEYGDQIKITHDVDDGLAEIGADALTKLGEQLLRATKGG